MTLILWCHIFRFFLGSITSFPQVDRDEAFAVAFDRAVRCFRHLLVQNATLNGTDSAHVIIATFAVAAGDLEILLLLDTSAVSFAGMLFTAAEGGNFSVFMSVVRHTNGTNLRAVATEGRCCTSQ
jgi:hypothetical protein